MVNVIGPRVADEQDLQAILKSANIEILEESVYNYLIESREEHQGAAIFTASLRLLFCFL